MYLRIARFQAEQTLICSVKCKMRIDCDGISFRNLCSAAHTLTQTHIRVYIYDDYLNTLTAIALICSSYNYCHCTVAVVSIVVVIVVAIGWLIHCKIFNCNGLFKCYCISAAVG